jgi:hypothetical protein
MLPPYFAGSARSRLLAMLGAGHQGVTLAGEELGKIAGWVDLNVPYCGDYAEANVWSAEEQAKYQHFLAKRQRMVELERQGVVEMLDPGR